MIIRPSSRLAFIDEYYFSRKLAEVRRLRESGCDVINIGIGSPDLPPTQEAIAELCRTSQAADTHGYLSHYPLKVAMAHWYGRTYGVSLDPDSEVLPLMGSKEGIVHLSLAFLEVGDKVLVPNPGYPTYTSASYIAQAQPLYYPLDERHQWQPNWDVLNDMDTQDVKILWVNYPQMPTGARASTQLFDALVRYAHDRQLLLVNDNPYSLVLNPEPLSLLAADGAKEVALELNSLSKSHNMAGWRVGMLLGATPYLREVLKVKSNMDSGMFLGIQRAATLALNETSEEWHDTRNHIYQSRRYWAERIAQTLQCSFNPDQVGMFLWAKAPDEIGIVSEWLDRLLYEANVFIAPGFIFGTAGERFIRISLCADEERLQTAWTRINAHCEAVRIF